MCNFCNSKTDNWDDGERHDFLVDGDTLCYFDSQYGWEGVKIKYCPMCGRKLIERYDRAAQGGTRQERQYPEMLEEGSRQRGEK